MKRVYLAGAINGCTDDEAITWREWFKSPEKSNVSARFKGFAKYVDPMKRDYRGKELTDYREIVDMDKRDVQSCDVVVAMYVKPSVGTSMEILFAWERSIPVILINESDKPLSPWLIYHSTAVVNSKEEAAEKLRFWMN